VTAVVVLVIVVVAAKILRPERPLPEEEPARLSEEVIDKALPLVEAQQYAPAILLMEAYCRQNPDDAEVRPLLAEALYKAGRYDDARDVVGQLLDRAAENARGLWVKGLLVQRDGGDPRELFRRAAESASASGVIWAAYGRVLLDGGNVAEAKSYLQRARDIGTEDARVLTALGEIALGEGRFGEAESLLSEALDHSLANARAWAMLAEAQKRSGRREEAYSTLRRSVVACPAESALCLGAAEMAFDLHQYEQADQFAQLASERGADEQFVERLKSKISARRTATSSERE
jgi:Tfp pilus assembly protein PilF